MKKILLPLFLIILLASGLMLFRVRLTQLNENSCINSSQVNFNGKLIFSLSQEQIEKNLKEKFACISGVNLIKIYPSKLKLEIQTETPVAKIAGTEFLATTDGLITQGTRENLPTIFLPAGLSASSGQRLTDKVTLFTISLASHLLKSDFLATNIRIISDNEIAIYDAKETIAIFTPEESAESQVDSLQQVIALAKIDEQKIAKIDLRYKKPVVTFK